MNMYGRSTQIYAYMHVSSHSYVERKHKHICTLHTLHTLRTVHYAHTVYYVHALHSVHTCIYMHTCIWTYPYSYLHMCTYVYLRVLKACFFRPQRNAQPLPIRARIMVFYYIFWHGLARTLFGFLVIMLGMIWYDRI